MQYGPKSYSHLHFTSAKTWCFIPIIYSTRTFDSYTYFIQRVYFPFFDLMELLKNTDHGLLFD